MTDSNRKLNILLVCEESAGLQLLKAIAQSEHRIVAVMASPSNNDSVAGVWNRARKMGYATLPAELVKNEEFADKVCSEKVDLLLNVHSLYIINEKVLRTPSIGSFNLHPGPLPKYAGLNAVSWAIYRGESRHGVTIHRISSKIDAGDIAYQAAFAIEENETALSLSFKCVKKGVELMLKLTETAASEPAKIPCIRQDLSRREFFLRRDVPYHGNLSWSWPAKRIIRFIRACDYYPFSSPWGHPLVRFGEKEVAIVKASLSGRVTGEVVPGTVGKQVDSGKLVACTDEWILLEKLKIDGEFLSPSALLKSGEILKDGSGKLE